jgi:hypothetical protein
VPGSADTEAEYTGRWSDDVAPQAATERNTEAVNWRIGLLAPDWQLEGDVRGRNDIAAR